MIQLVVGDKDITQAIKPPVQIEDDVTYGAVKLSVDVKHIPSLFTLKNGLPVILKINDKVWFEGIIFDWSRTFSDDGRFVAYDPFVYFLKNKADFEWRRKTPTQITAELLSRYGLKPKEIVQVGYTFEKVLCRAQDYDSVYSVLITVWSEASKRTGKKYWLRYEQGARFFERVPQSKVPILSALENTEYGESIEEMINSVAIVDREKKIVVTEKNDSLIKQFGLLGTVEDYSAENKADATRYAKQKLNESGKVKINYSISAVLPLSVQRFWSGDFVYIPDSNKVNLHGYHFQKASYEIYKNFVKLQGEMGKSDSLPSLEFKEVKEEKEKKPKKKKSSKKKDNKKKQDDKKVKK